MESAHTVIDKRSRVYRAFHWSLVIVDRWRGSEGRYVARFEYGTGLWHFYLTVHLWMALAVLSTIVTWICMPLFLIILPIEAEGVMSYLTFAAAFMIGAVIISLVRLVVSVWADNDRPPFPSRKYFPGPLQLAKKLVLGRLDQVRPLVTFTEEERRS